MAGGSPGAGHGLRLSRLWTLGAKNLCLASGGGGRHRGRHRRASEDLRPAGGVWGFRLCRLRRTSENLRAVGDGRRRCPLGWSRGASEDLRPAGRRRFRLRRLGWAPKNLRPAGFWQRCGLRRCGVSPENLGSARGGRRCLRLRWRPAEDLGATAGGRGHGMRSRGMRSRGMRSRRRRGSGVRRTALWGGR